MVTVTHGSAGRTVRKDPRAFVMVMGVGLMALTLLALGVTQLAVYVPWRF